MDNILFLEKPQTDLVSMAEALFYTSPIQYYFSGTNEGAAFFGLLYGERIRQNRVQFSVPCIPHQLERQVGAEKTIKIPIHL
jgi:hypothetical protein